MAPITSKPSTFIISLDFELYWGVRDVKALEEYRENLEGVYTAIPQMLALFQQYEIHVTWATVGFLFLNNFKELLANKPDSLPGYPDKNLSQYDYAAKMEFETDEKILKLHFAPALIEQIKKTPYQEIGSHTFSHYYSLEDDQTTKSFDDDLKKNIEIASKAGIELRSLVFPRNQVNPLYYSILTKNKISSFRGQQNGWMHTPGKSSDYNNVVKRGLRYADTFFDINAGTSKVQIEGALINIPASRFLQPYSKRKLDLEKRKIQRIKDEMLHVAQAGGIYHLWWHPHNFGKYTDENLIQLEEILSFYKKLNEDGKMISANMYEIANERISR